MDGARDRPLAHAAEGRGHEAVAEAVTVPSRSVLRRSVFATGVPAADVIVDLTLRPWPPESPVAPSLGPAAEAPAASAQIVAAANAPKPTRRKTRGVVVASSLGALAAVGIVAAVVLLRSQVDTGPSPVAAATAPEMVVEPAAAEPTVYLRVGPDLAAEERQRIETALAEAGYVRVLVQEMPFSISRSRVGYFHEMDRETAEALIGALRGTHEGLVLRDYRSLIAEPEPGRLDLWIRS